MSERKRLIFTAVGVSLLAILTGLFLGGDLLPSQGTDEKNSVRTATGKTVTTVEHAHDGIPMHKHVITKVITVAETTPHGDVRDVAAATLAQALWGGVSTSNTPEASNMPTMPTVGNVTQTTDNTTQAVTNTTQIYHGAPVMVQGKYEVWLYSRRISPTAITVPAGTTVVWKNVDSDFHTITSNDGLFDFTIYTGQSENFTFTKPGIYSYYCVPHPDLQGTVFVVR